jgi:hypothetical protein
MLTTFGRIGTIAADLARAVGVSSRRQALPPPRRYSARECKTIIEGLRGRGFRQRLEERWFPDFGKPTMPRSKPL